jgi:hypothetical protein
MGQTIAVTVKGFSVTESIDPKSKTEIPTKFKPKAVSALKSVSVDPLKGKTLAPYSAGFAVTIKEIPKGLRAEVKFTFFDQEPYSKKDKLLGGGTSGANVQSTNPDKADTEAAIQAALDDAIESVIGGVKDNAKKP